ncbi:MAG: hypothetical protein HYV09_16925 [Deltaproteobacteria bacterium]|nr:hypothetical protein [Deltaproteobacteria bacterium]
MRLAARIEEELGERVDLQVGARGQFDVLVDEQVVASKQRVSLSQRLLGADGFPDVESTVDAVEARLSSP